MRKRWSVLATVAAIVMLGAGESRAVPLTGLQQGNNTLIFFQSQTPGTIDGTVVVTGLAPGDTLIGIETRPANDGLYGLSQNERIYLINPTTGVGTLASTITTNVTNNFVGIDFNPVVDRLRLVNASDQNLRINVDTGVAIVDTPLAYAVGDPNAGANPAITGEAYTNNVPNAGSTTLYGIDANLNILVQQPNPNSGQLTTVGALGVNPDQRIGFEIDRISQTPFAALFVGGASRLYTINLGTGAATLQGTIGTGTPLIGLASGTMMSSAIPEPGTLASVGFGAVALLVVARRRRRAKVAVES